MLTGEIPASPLAISICAPYGISPCTVHERVSRMLAVFRLSRPKRSVICRAMPPVVTMAIVLFAVHRFATLTSAAMHSSAPRLPCMRRVSFRITKSIPPFQRISSSMPPASSVTIISSLMPMMPVPIDATQSNTGMPHSAPARPVAMMPMKSTSITFMPLTASASTSR